MKLFSFSSCSTCRKAIKWLNGNDISFELIDILINPPSKTMLISACELYGDRKFLLNTTGSLYRMIGPAVVKKMSDKQFFDKLFEEPKLIKRPFLYKHNKCLLIGFNEEKWAKKLL